MSRTARTPPPAAELRRLYVDEHLTAEAVGQRFGASKRTTRRWLTAAGIPLRARGLAASPRPDADELRRRFLDEGHSAADIAADYQVTRRTVHLWLRTEGIKAAVPNRVRRQPPPAETLRELYENQRLTTETLGARYGVSKRTAGRWLRDVGIPPRAAGRNTPVPSTDELRHAYLEQQLTLDAIAAHFGTTRRTVTRWLHAAEIPNRGRHQRPDLPVAELRRLYEVDRLPGQALADRYGVSVEHVRETLRAAGVNLRVRSAGAHVVPVPPADDLRRLYTEEGLGITRLGEMFGVSKTTVVRWLREASIPVRPVGAGLPQPPASTLRRMYLEQRRSTRDIGLHYGVNQRTVTRWLRSHDIPVRPRSTTRTGAAK